ncbi:serine/threonine-protein kinase [Isoptericola croceus]|uniref:serine/threonine-protein kinase n=1 Tax=Isoptericola croceus TaxID=3031406 RepID=UPI0023F6F3A5|nr:serine/threonine-protein kinase [Isoptericola croceus]
MSSRRAPSAPPEIPGYEFRKLIGSGGFSDVFLYEQRRPRRQVAVKVLLKEWSSDTQRAAFDAEADLMATLGNHPSIVTMFEAGVAPDNRPYLAMEHCSRPNLGSRYRSERLSVAEAMRTTIQIAGAVETAHRLGILHRDIKPANILVTQFGHPVLTDFGISSTVDSASVAEGMSIPWSPPESFGDPPVSGIATDVWALGATCYTLLAGRTPFEVPGGSNASADLMSRIATAPLPGTGRGDVPDSLERVLRIAMAKQPASRYPTALAFARAMQQVQVELARDMTPIDILDESGGVHVEEDEADGTRMNRITAIDPGQAPAARSAASPGSWGPPGSAGSAGSPAVPTAGGSSVPLVGAPGLVAAPTGTAPVGAGPGIVPTVAGGQEWAGVPVDETVHRTQAPSSATPDGAVDDAPARSTSWWPLVGGAVGLVAVGGLVWWLVTSTGGTPEAEPTGESTTVRPVEPLGGYVPPVRELDATVDGDDVVVTWEPPRELQDGDVYGWRQLSLTSESRYEETAETSVRVPDDPGQDVCVEVVVVRASKPSVAVQACADEA